MTSMESIYKKHKSFIDPLESKVKLQGVESSLHIIKPRYSTHLKFEEEEE